MSTYIHIYTYIHTQVHCNPIDGSVWADVAWDGFADQPPQFATGYHCGRSVSYTNAHTYTHKHTHAYTHTHCTTAAGCCLCIHTYIHTYIHAQIWQFPFGPQGWWHVKAGQRHIRCEMWVCICLHICPIYVNTYVSHMWIHMCHICECICDTYVNTYVTHMWIHMSHVCEDMCDTHVNIYVAHMWIQMWVYTNTAMYIHILTRTWKTLAFDLRT